MKSFILALALTITLPLQSHPSWGIAVDSKGDVYFVDVMHNDGTLWKYEVKTGKTTALITGHFHAHNMQITPGDVLYIGTQIWIDGEIMGDGHNYFFKYDIKTNKLDTLIYSENYERFFGGEALYDKGLNRVFFFHDGKLRAYNLDSEKSLILSNRVFDRKCTMILGQKGDLYISDAMHDNGTIWHYKNQMGVQKIADNLIDQNPKKPVYPEKRFQLFYGMAFTADQNLIYTENANRTVVELTGGMKKVLYQSPEKYHPTAVALYDEKYYIIEVGYLPGKGHVGPNLVVLEDDKIQRIKLGY
ncbi:MAG: hypothetical protein RIE58_01390 [Vicingaceae bacterium]